MCFGLKGSEAHTPFTQVGSPSFSLQVPRSQCDRVPYRRKPREHASEQLSATLCSWQQVQQLAVPCHGRRVETVAVGGGSENFKVLTISFLFFKSFVLHIPLLKVGLYLRLDF